MRIEHQIIPLVDLVNLWLEHHKLGIGESVARADFFQGTAKMGENKIAVTLYIRPQV